MAVIITEEHSRSAEPTDLSSILAELESMSDEQEGESVTNKAQEPNQTDLTSTANRIADLYGKMNGKYE
jgi:hypothetical protein